MREMMRNLIDGVSQHPLVEKMCQSEFCRGVIVGIIAGILFIWLVRLISWLDRRNGRCREIIVRNSNGKVFIGASAIGGVLKKAAEKLNGLSINKIIIRRDVKGYTITLRAAMSVNDGGTAPRLIHDLSYMVKEQMLAVFGVDNITDVTLMIDSCSGSADLPERAADEADGGRTVRISPKLPETPEEAPGEEKKEAGQD